MTAFSGFLLLALLVFDQFQYSADSIDHLVMVLSTMLLRHDEQYFLN